MIETWAVYVSFDGEKPSRVGWAHYATSSDILSEQIFSDPIDETVAEGRESCERPPPMENPHRLKWAELVHTRRNGESWGLDMSTIEAGTMCVLFCPTCFALVAWPHDGYVYGSYPAEWLELVDP